MARSICAARGCGRDRKQSHLMCRACWALVPPEVQTQVYDGNRKMQAGEGAEDWLAALEFARAAVEANRG